MASAECERSERTFVLPARDGSGDGASASMKREIETRSGDVFCSVDVLCEGSRVYGLRAKTLVDPHLSTLFCPVCDFDSVGGEFASALDEYHNNERICTK